MKLVLLYLPVVHRGYLEFLEKHQGSACAILGRAALAALGPEADYILRKDHAIRGIPEGIAAQFVEQLGLYSSVQVLTPDGLAGVTELIVPDEDVSTLAAAHFFPGASVTYDGSLRLRYDRKGVARVDPVPEDCLMTSDEAHRQLMGKAEKAAVHSRDWWLQVGALLAKDGVPLVALYNQATPDPGMTAVLGDPRSLYSRGEGTDDTLVNHAELQLVSWAGYHGVSTNGADVYVTHFPCGPCGGSLAGSGIKRLFFKSGYSKLESASVLKAKGVELIRVV